MHRSIQGGGHTRSLQWRPEGKGKGKSKGKGKDKQNKGYSWNGGGGHYAAWGEGFVQKTVPKNAIGLILGAGGRNIKDLQAVPGINYVWLDSEAAMLTICGTEEAVASVGSQVEKQIHSALMGSDVELSVTLVDLGVHSGGMVVLTPAKDIGLPVDLSDGAPGREYFALCSSPHISLEEQMAAMALSCGEDRSTGRPEVSARGRLVVGVDQAGFLPEFENVIEKLRAQQPGSSRIRAEARFGNLLFARPPAGLTMGRAIPAAAFAKLECHKDLQPRFFGSMRVPCIVRIRQFLLERGFQSVPPEERKVVHLIDATSLKKLSITVAEREDGTDSRSGDEGKEEIERIAQCRDYFEVLQVTEDCADKDVQKAYYRLAKLVHPDKNVHLGAESAWKAVLQCKEVLIDAEKRTRYSRNRVAPPAVERGVVSKRLKVVKCFSNQRKHLVQELLKLDDELGARVLVRSYSDQRHDQELMRFLDEAWAKQEDGMLSVGSGTRFRIDTVRYKTRYRFTDGDLKVVIEHVRQKDVGLKVAQDRWEVEVRSQALKEALKSVPGMGGGRREDLARLFNDYVGKVSALAEAMTSDGIRMLKDSPPTDSAGGSGRPNENRTLELW